MKIIDPKSFEGKLVKESHTARSDNIIHDLVSFVSTVFSKRHVHAIASGSPEKSSSASASKERKSPDKKKVKLDSELQNIDQQ